MFVDVGRKSVGRKSEGLISDFIGSQFQNELTGMMIGTIFDLPGSFFLIEETEGLLKSQINI